MRGHAGIIRSGSRWDRDARRHPGLFHFIRMSRDEGHIRKPALALSRQRIDFRRVSGNNPGRTGDKPFRLSRWRIGESALRRDAGPTPARNIIPIFTDEFIGFRRDTASRRSGRPRAVIPALGRSRQTIRRDAGKRASVRRSGPKHAIPPSPSAKHEGHPRNRMPFG